MSHAFLGLGSNLGDRVGNLKSAALLLQQHSRIKITKMSSVYETEPIGNVEQPGFLNCVILTETDLAPNELLKVVNQIEMDLKRERSIRWGPRTIDIDILLFENKKINEPELIIPHPRICERAFVLVPLLELSPQIEIPGVGKAKDCVDIVQGQGIKKLAALDIGDIINE
ncbi:MAG: 2-amino-4-hydroxy-6-hydroxymethyldihydropteridine diphosphokinase [Rubrobacteridae bacterium]|nr:2-amino-4-hydroxy-6-hydroxymethyldihydropteridine diphosphokinase [Rubrobacteridae bacterium]